MLSAAALPLTYFPILVIANDPGVHGRRHTNGRLLNAVATRLPRHPRRSSSVATIPLMIITKAGPMTAGRVLHAALHLLDRQLRDRDGELCGKVDDLELEQADDGTWYVTAILTGPGHLLYRLGRRTAGTWLSASSPPTSSGRRSTTPAASRTTGSATSASPSTSPSTPTTSPRSPPSAGPATTSSDTSRGAATMRISDLLACDVVDARRPPPRPGPRRPPRDGRPAARRPRRAPRSTPSSSAASAVAGRLGYLRGGVRGPALLKAVM